MSETTKQEILKGKETELEENTFTRKNYTFRGWSTNKNSTVAEYADKQAVTFTEDTTLYAVWRSNTIDSIVEGYASYGNDFTIEYAGWKYNEGGPVGGVGGGNAVCHKWLGDSSNEVGGTDFIQFQPASVADICSGLSLETNPNNYFFYKTSDEVGHMYKGSDPESMNNRLVGVGGIGLTKMQGIGDTLVTKIEFSPNASSVSYDVYRQNNGYRVITYNPHTNIEEPSSPEGFQSSTIWNWFEMGRGCPARDD